MKGNWNIEPDNDEDFEFLPPDIDTELGYDCTGQLWRCNNHNPVHEFIQEITSRSHHVNFCSNCTWRKNCLDGTYDIVSQNCDLDQWLYEDYDLDQWLYED